MSRGVLQPLSLHHDSSIPAGKPATRAKKRYHVVSTSGGMLALHLWKVMQSEENTGNHGGKEKGGPRVYLSNTYDQFALSFHSFLPFLKMIYLMCTGVLSTCVSV